MLNQLRSGTIIGMDLPFVDAKQKVTGKAEYLADINYSGMLYGKILRSPYPHAMIKKIDITRAVAMPGVKAVISAKDAPNNKFGLSISDVNIFAVDKVRYMGDEVAAVAAESESIAERALELIEVVYEELHGVYNTEEAMKEGAPLVHDDKENNIATTYHIERGTVEKDFDRCDYVFEDEFVTSLVQPAYMEPMGCIAKVESNGRLTIWTSVQSAFQARSEIAKALGMSASDIVLRIPYIGGGFGGKIWIRNLHPICSLLALKTGAPVKIVLTRQEEFYTMRPRVGAKIKLKTGVLKDGTLVAKQAHVVCTNGAYSWAAPKIMLNMSMRSDCLYRYKSTKTDAYLVYTNTVPTSGFRGYGNPQMHFAVESQMDMIARRLNLDPVKIRLKNAIKQGDITLHGWNVRSCGLSECIAKVAAGIREDCSKEVDSEGRFKRGVGIACMTHVSGNRTGNTFDGSSAIVKFQEDGRVLVYTGESDMGQGAKTVLAQVTAETLGLPLEAVIVEPFINTDVAPFCIGTYSSRVTTVAGNAVLHASLEVKEKLLKLAGKILDTEPEQLLVEDGIVKHRSDKQKAIEIAEVCRIAIRTREAVELSGVVSYDPPTEGIGDDYYGDYSSAYTYGAQAVEVEVDTETGKVKLLRVVAAHDVGFAINPKGVTGQVEGGIAQGAGWALYENLVLKDGIIQNPSFKSYIIMTSMDVADVKVHIIETNDPVGPYGAKGVGEPALIPTAPAIANAVEDAVGVRIAELPITPEKVFWQMRE
jgi:CO/xanthine dehydrogenase Mo-binding subunit